VAGPGAAIPWRRISSTAFSVCGGGEVVAPTTLRPAIRLEHEVPRDAEARCNSVPSRSSGCTRFGPRSQRVGHRPAAASRRRAANPLSARGSGDRLGELALAVARHACDRDDLARAHDERRARTAASPRSPLRPDVLELEHGLAAVRSRVADPPLSSLRHQRWRSDRSVASAAATVAIERPPRSTVTRRRPP